MRFVWYVALVTLAACHQIHHPTHVRPGFRVEAASGVARFTGRENKDGSGHDVALGVSYGKRLPNAAALVQVTAPITEYFHDANPGQVWPLPSLSLFLQGDAADDHVSYGLGGTLGLRPAAYTQLGLNAAPSARRSFSLDLGLRVDTASAVAPYGLLTANFGWLDVGAWIDNTFYLVDPMNDPDNGYEETDADYSEQRFSAGVLFRARIERPMRR